MMFCHKCGAQQTEGSEFCRKCGTRLVASESNNAAKNSAQEQSRNDINRNISQNTGNINSYSDSVIVNEKKSKKGCIIPVIIIFVLVFIILIIAIIGAIADEETEPTPNNTNNQQYTENYNTGNVYFEWVDEPVEVKKDDCIYLNGSIKNISGKDLFNISINYMAYDADGNELGTFTDSTHNLKPGNTWKFSVVFYDTIDGKIASYEFVDVKYYEE